MSNLIHRFAAIEQKLDTVLFRRMSMEDDGITAGGVAKTAAGAAVVGGIGYGGYRAHSAVIDRMGGMNMTRTAGTPALAGLSGYGKAAKDLMSEGTAPLRNEYAALRAGVRGSGQGAFGQAGAVAGKGVFRSSLGALKKVLKH